MDGLIDQLTQRFEIGASVAHFCKCAQTRKQRSGESLNEFADAISQFIVKGYPDFKGFNSNIRKDLAIDLFRGGVKFETRQGIIHLPNQPLWPKLLSKRRKKRKIYSQTKDLKDILQPVELDECWKLINEGKIKTGIDKAENPKMKELTRVDENIFATQTEIEANFATVGSRETFKIDYIVPLFSPKDIGFVAFISHWENGI